MKNRSQELLKKRGLVFEKRRIKEKNEVEVLFSKISSSLSLLDHLVTDVEKECTVYCRPTFKSRIETARKIEKLKYEVAVNLTKAKGVMDYFAQNYKKSINYVLVESIGVHFHYKIDGLIGRLNQSLAAIENIRNREDSPGPNDTTGVEGVYKSVYYISTIIRELKTVVVSQSDKIERLDMAMEHVSSSAYKSIHEIGSISTFGSHIKNRIISVLFCSILVLVAVSTIKAYSQSTRKSKAVEKNRDQSRESTLFRLGVREALPSESIFHTHGM